MFLHVESGWLQWHWDESGNRVFKGGDGCVLTCLYVNW